jgi:hypothetical protein
MNDKEIINNILTKTKSNKLNWQKIDYRYHAFNGKNDFNCNLELFSKDNTYFLNIFKDHEIFKCITLDYNYIALTDDIEADEGLKDLYEAVISNESIAKNDEIKEILDSF